MTVLKEAPEHLLLAEDDDDDFLIFSIALRDTELAATLARPKNGDQLMAMLAEHIPDILFLDLDMPCKDGRQCLKEIRSDRRYDNLPIIVYTSFSNHKTIDYCMTEGATRYMVKPSTIEELTGMLKQILTTDWKNGFSDPGNTDFIINPPSLIL